MTSKTRWTLVVVAFVVVVAGVILAVVGPKRWARHRQMTLIRNANVCMSRGEYREAESHLRQLNDRMPNNPGVLLRLADVCVQLKKFEEARTWIDQASAIVPKEPGPVIVKASTYRQEASQALPKSTVDLSEVERVERLCDQAEALLKSVGDVSSAQAHIQAERGRLLSVRADAARLRIGAYEAQADAAESAGQSADAATFRKLANEWRQKTGQFTTSSLRDLSEAYKLFSRDMGLAEDYAQTAFRARRWGEAVVVYRTASTLGRPTPRLAITAAQASRAAAVGKPAGVRRQSRQLAIEMLEQAVRNHPYNADVKLELAGFQIEAGSLDAAEELVRKVFTMSKAHPGATIMQARLLMLRGRPEEAKNTLASLQTTELERPDVRILQSGIEGLLGNSHRSLELLQHAVELDPYHMESRLHLAAALARRGMWDESIRILKVGLQQDPDAMALLAAIVTAKVRYGRTAGLEVLLENAERAAGGDAQTLVDLAVFCIRAGANERARRIVDQSLKSDPKSLASILVSAVTAIERGKAAEAIQALGPLANQRDQLPGVHLTLARAHGALGRLNEADAQLAQAAASSEGDYLTAYQVVETYMDLGLPDRGEHYSSQLLADDPEAPATLSQAARIAMLKGNLPEACSFMARLRRLGTIECSPLDRLMIDLAAGRYEKVVAEGRAQKTWMAGCIAFQAWVQLGKSDEALKEIEAAIRSAPTRLPPYLLMAEYLADVGKVKEGLTLLTLMQEINRPYGALAIGRLHYLMGDYQQAVATYEGLLANKNVTLDKQAEALVRLALASCYRQMNKPSDEMAVYQQMQKDPAISLDGIEAALELLIRMRDFAEINRVLDPMANAPAGIAPSLLIRMAAIYRAAGQADRAAAVYDRLAAQLPDSVGIPRMKADMYRGMGHKKKAVETYEQALRRWPGNRSLLIDWASALAENGQYPQSLQQIAELSLEGATGGIIADRQKGLLLAQLGLCETARPLLASVLTKTGGIDFELQWAMGRCLAGQGKIEEAMKLLGAIPTSAMHYPVARILMAGLEPDPGKALSILGEGATHVVSSEPLAMAYVQRALEAGRIEDAIGVANRWANRPRGDAASWALTLADALQRKGDLPGAIAVLRAAWRSRSENRGLGLRLATYLSAQKDWAGVREVLSGSGSSTKPVSTTQAAAPLGAVGECLLAMADLAEGKEDAAVSRLDAMLTRQDVSANWRTVAAMARLAAAKPTPIDAIVSKLPPGYDVGILRSAAEAATSKTGRLACRLAAASVLGRLLGLPALSHTLSKAAIEADREVAVGYAAEYAALRALGRASTGQAEKTGAEIIRRFGKTEVARRLSLRVALDRGDLDRVGSELRAWESEGGVPSDQLYESGSVALLRDRRTQALEWFEACLKRDPKNVGAANNVAFLLADSASQDTAAADRALTLAEEAYRASGGQAATADTLGWLLVKRGRAAEALPILQGAIGTLCEDIRAHYHIARAYEAVGNAPMARLHFEHVAGSAKDASLADEARKALARLPASLPATRSSATASTRKAA